MYGWKQISNCNPASVCEELVKLLKKVTGLNNIYLFRTQHNYLLEFEFVPYLNKTELLKEYKLLKGKDLSIFHYLILKQREKNKILRVQLKKAREIPKNHF